MKIMALIAVSLLAGLLCGYIWFFRRPTWRSSYRVHSVPAGDLLELEVGPHVEIVKLEAVATPDIDTPLGEVARKFLEERVAGQRVVIERVRQLAGGRWLVRAWRTDDNHREHELGHLMVANGFTMFGS